MRAPEVYQGLGCVHRSQIWALAATLFCWIKPGIFGTAGNTIILFRESWCIAKLMRLFPDWTGPPIENAVCRSEFELGKALIEESEPEILKVLSLEDEMQTMGMPPELRDLFRRLLVVDPNNRPSASEVLVSEEYLALKKKALTSTVG
jgi:serine/threonine protein kinase